MLTYPNIDPVLIHIGPLSIRWYSIAYIFGILFTIWFVNRENQTRKILSKEAADSLVTFIVIGIILGGRLGYVTFYSFEYYFLENPIEIFKIWNGGMSFHGGVLGVFMSIFLFCRKYKVNFLQFTDVLAVSAPIGLFFGRIANFINGELWGRQTNVPWAMIFPSDENGIPRHPSQLYEAILEGLAMFIILLTLYKKTNIREKMGALSGLFLMLYWLFRSFIELFREPDKQLGLFFNTITMGQILSLPMLIIGIYLATRVSTESKI